VLLRVLEQKSEQATLRLSTHNMLETHVNSHCNVTIIGYFLKG